MVVLPLSAQNDGVTLAGSLWEPPVPPRALLMMQPGSGPSDRDNDVLFPPIRTALLDAGIAVCSFDKRGVGASGGSWLTADIATQASDLAAALAAARQHLPDVTVGLFGHSQGGWVVLEAQALVAADFVVTNSGPGVTPRVQELFSTGAALDRLALSAGTRTAAERLFTTMLDLMGAGAPFARASELLAEPRYSEARAALVEAHAFVPEDQALWDFASTIIDHDPAPALRRIDVPLLALFGDMDDIVPVAASIERLRTTVPEELLTVRVLPGGDHRLQVDDSESFATGYLEELIEFVAART